VGATDPSGKRCAFSNSGALIGAMAPGCEMDLADPTTGEPWSLYSGATSAAAVSTSALIALVRSYRPSLTWSATEELVKSSEHMDVERVFRGAGLGHLVDIARDRMPEVPETAENPPPSLVSPAPQPVANHDSRISRLRSLPRPALGGLRRTGRVIHLRVRNRPPRAGLAVLLKRRQGDFRYSVVRRGTTSRSSLRVRLPRSWTRGSIEIFFIQAQVRGPAVTIFRAR
jgi:hypothetical protein